MSEIDPRTDRRANCIGEDPNLFFPTRGGSQVRRIHEQAKAICAECVIREGCLEHALDSYEIYGTWGGMTEEERAPLHRKHGHAPRPCLHCKRPMSIKLGGARKKFCSQRCSSAYFAKGRTGL